jgi:Flp pilus assembly protein TadG
MNDCCDDRAFWQGRLDKKKALLAAFDDALLAIAGGAQSYSIDTGQTRQVVTKANLTETRNMMATLEAEIATLMQRLGGCGTIQVRPAW